MRPGCNGLWQQAKLPCPTPEACELADIKRIEERLFNRTALIALCAVLLSAAVAALWSGA